MRRGFPLSRTEGTASRQAHADLPDGTYERELGKEGFFGPASHMHHRHPPTGWSSIEGPLRPRAFDASHLGASRASSPWDAAALMSNAHVEIGLWRLEAPMEALARDADGDLLLFAHEGAGALFCDYGHLDFRDGDYLILPRGTMWRIVPAAPCTFLMIEAVNDGFALPDRGLLGATAIFDPAILDVPAIDDAFRAQQDERAWDVAVKRRGAVSRIAFPHNPLDAIGWHGTLMPVRLNWRDIRPVMSARYHIPPSGHTTFVAARFVVCTFAPRPLESDPGALKLPFFHNNDDYDEVIFYHRGSFLSRDNIGPGWLTLHPSGITHGPHPKAFEAAKSGTKRETDEVAVMIDTRDALDVAELPDGVEWRDYVDSWKSR